MTRSRVASRWACSAVVLLVGSASADTGPGATDSSHAQCLAAYEDGQRARQVGKYGNARDAFSLCGGATCPVALHADCQRWLGEVETATPTVVFHVLGPEGNALSGVQVKVDNQPTREVNGRAIELDPGPHVLLFSLHGYVSRQERMTFSEGEKLSQRNVVMELEDNPPPLSEEPALMTGAKRSYLPGWIGLGVAGAGLASFAYFGASARSNDEALGGCIPNCTQSKVNKVEQQYLVANISLGLAGASLLGAAAWWLLGGEEGSTTVTAREKVSFYVGSTAGLVGSF